MTIKELKELITNKTVPSDFMIFVSKDSTFLASQYVQAIEQLAEGSVNKIKSIYEPLQSSVALLTTTKGTINILTVETFDERAEDYSQFEHTIVVCEQIDKSIAKNVENFVINFPKLEDWQILDYAKSLCTGIDEKDLMWFINAANNDINIVLNELNKIALFNKAEQPEIFAALYNNMQSDLYKADLFNIVNALVDGDLLVLYEFIKHKGYNSLEPIVLANRALTSLKNILLVTQNPGITPNACGMSVGQYNFLRSKYRSLNVEAAHRKIKFLSQVDLDLKNSKLDLSKYEMINYLVSHLGYKISI